MSSVAEALRQRDLELYVIINKATWLLLKFIPQKQLKACHSAYTT